MKEEAILDISEITHSREMYEAKPRPFASAFIYILLTMVAAAIVYTSVGTIDIVIKANGLVRPNSQVSTVKNLIAGDVTSIEYENGMMVEEGQVLMTLGHSDALLSQELLKSQISEKNIELDMLSKYKDSVKDGMNLFDEATEEVYYNRYNKFKLDYQINAHDIEFTDQLNATKQANVIVQINDLKNGNAYLGMLEKSIVGQSDEITGSTSLASYYQSQYDKFLLDYETIKQQFDDKALEITLGEHSELSVRTLEDVKSELKGYQWIKASLENKVSTVSKTDLVAYDSYYKMYESYIQKSSEYEKTYLDAKSNYELNLSLQGIAVTKNQVATAEQNMTIALNTFNDYKMNYYLEVTNHITDLEVKSLEYASANTYEEAKSSILSNNQVAKERALDKYKSDTLVALRQEKETNESNLLQLNQTMALLSTENSKQLMSEQSSDYAILDYYKTNELVTTLNAMEVLKDEIKSLEGQLARVTKDIEQAVITAQIGGRVNVVTDIARGDTIFAGTHILTIVPEDDTAYKIQVLLGNKDVAKVKVGDSINYHFAALPYRDYGELTGHITKISTDAQFNEATGQSYYQVEATLNENMAYDYKGNVSEVKVGMLCEAQVITDEKTILRFLLEKINLLD